MSDVREVNFDGLVGPTHNYGGLSLGNIASMSNLGAVSNPRAAALQGLQKMRRLLEMGLPQAVLPPQERPHIPSLHAMGYRGSDADILARSAKDNLALLANAASASAMWTANAATVSPSADSSDGRVHLTPANLGAMFHRSIEADQTTRTLQTIFSDPQLFQVHEPIPGGAAMGDEGAANHGRICAEHGAPGLQLFVYGRSAFERGTGQTRFRPRQALEASEAVARQHGLDPARTVFLRQSQVAIDAGAFHNDVVAVANGQALLYHEDAFADEAEMQTHVTRATESLGFAPHFLRIARDEVSLDDAISSYLFNSQLISLTDGGMLLVLPLEAQENPRTHAAVEALIAGDSPVIQADYLDLRQSMRNGGGPACLRLRVALSAEERAGLTGRVVLDEPMIDRLEDWVRTYYRDRLAPEDLADPALLIESRTALDELTQLLELGRIYHFQQLAGGVANKLLSRTQTSGLNLVR